MARFFLPQSTDEAVAESEYDALRDRAEASTGLPTRDRRIHELECRRQGQDCRLRVGEADAANGRTIAAILQLGRDAYAVHHVPGQPDQPLPAVTVIRRADVYAVTDFD
jgi:hypothetical protein